MRLLSWTIFIAGLFAAGFLGGQTAAFIFLVAVVLAITLFRLPLVLPLTRLGSWLGLTRETIERMAFSIQATRASGPTDAARPILAALAANNFVAAGAWNIAQMPKIHVALMVQREEGVQLYADEIRFRKAMGK